MCVCVLQNASDALSTLLSIRNQSESNPISADISTTRNRQRFSQRVYHDDVTPRSRVYDVINDVDITSQTSAPREDERCHSVGCWLRDQSCVMSSGSHLQLLYRHLMDSLLTIADILVSYENTDQLASISVFISSLSRHRSLLTDIK